MPTRTLNHRSQLQLWASRPSTPQRSLPTTLARLLLPRQRLLATLTPTPSSSMTTSRHVQHKPPCAQSDLPNSLTAFRVTPGSAFLCATFLLLGQLASRKNDTGRFLCCPAAPSTEKLLACLFACLFALLLLSCFYLFCWSKASIAYGGITHSEDAEDADQGQERSLDCERVS